MSFLLLLSLPASAGGAFDLVENAPTVVWAGVDYTPTQVFVPETFDDPEASIYFEPHGGLGDEVLRFADPKAAWDRLVADWNTMLTNEFVEDYEKVIRRDIVVDLPAPAGQTSHKPPFFQSNYEARNHPPAFTADDVSALVKRYRLKSRDGVGFVFIAERFSKDDKEGCVWPTIFDVKKKTVLQTSRVCEAPGGGQFRNYWLNPVEDAAKALLKELKSGAK